MWASDKCVGRGLLHLASASTGCGQVCPWVIGVLFVLQVRQAAGALKNPMGPLRITGPSCTAGDHTPL